MKFSKTQLIRAFIALALTACVRDDAPTNTTSAEREGLVSVSASELTEFPLDWQAPRASGEPTVKAQMALAEKALREGRILEGDRSAAAHVYAARLAGAQGEEFETLRRQVAHAVIVEGDAQLKALANNDPEADRLAHLAAAILRTLARDDAETQLYLSRVDASDRLEALLLLADKELATDRLGEQNIGAQVDFKEVLRNRPKDVRAIAGLHGVQRALAVRAWRASAARDYENVTRWMQFSDAVIENKPYIAAQWRALEKQRMQQVIDLYNDALIDLQDPGARGAISSAQANLSEMKRLAVKGDGSVAELQRRIDTARAYGSFQMGQQFKEALRSGGFAPEMRVLPIGMMMMGASKDDPDARPSEMPAHRVHFVRGVAMSLNEVTVGEFAAFVRATGFRSRAERRGHSIIYNERTGNFARSSGVTWRDDYAGKPAPANYPVVHVDVRDAEAYAAWLSTETRRAYRLPHESEFEYALRATNPGRFPWGNAMPTSVLGNLTGDGDVSPSGRRWANAFPNYRDGEWGPAPVGQYRANAFGLHDMAGNVSEWTSDCWHQGYRRAPADGSAWTNPGCRSRVIRGGSWASSPAQHRSAWRMAQAHDITNARTGFRVARDI